MKKIIFSIFYLFFPLFIGGIIAFLIRNHIDYNLLQLPPLAPPKILFPLAWTLIYLLMGLSYFLYKKEYKEFDFVNFIYYLQLFINGLWSIIFFLWKLRLLSIVWTLLLDFFVLLLIYLFSKRVKLTTYLNIPYLLWILFATYLTIGIFILN